ncbi:anthranilate synthase component I family protein [Chryseobacterium nematophagum]|uniref:Anthranilate synthase component 1 n=1 Tax=Chryseobacterium nematophagum TaxID=2305228 RepID=A0A3M7TKI6_9FLAO|nr:anthranilate synthase component I family protein [Chryseobacterium nematophagum]RNA63536.1 anthranilate synthase component I family protein [Chryseobacterium nematophagum]
MKEAIISSKYMDIPLISSDSFNIERFYHFLRQKKLKSIWFESTETVNREHHKLIFIGIDPIASLQLKNEAELYYSIGDQEEYIKGITNEEVWNYVEEWQNKILPKETSHSYNGILGFSSYDSIQLVENIRLKKYEQEHAASHVPMFKFSLYRYMYVFNKTLSHITLINNFYDQENELKVMEDWLKNNEDHEIKEFHVSDQENRDCSDGQFLEKIKQAQYHCQVGDVFQLVVSRRFSRDFTGDPWSFFLELKKNNAQYYFFLDEENYIITGASPETHFSCLKGLGVVKPIAGTYRKTMDEVEDALLEEKLLKDPKENSEHNMLIDLARNDLSKHARNVHISKLKIIEHYNNIIHLVSQVEGEMDTDHNPLRLIKEFLPAGTLCGAPKYRAVQLIDEIENSYRSYYGGLLGWIGFNNDINTCILIRSALFENNTMIYRAGAGVVISSEPQKELEEVNNKLGLILNTLKKFIILP